MTNGRNIFLHLFNKHNTNNTNLLKNKRPVSILRFKYCSLRSRFFLLYFLRNAKQI